MPQHLELDDVIAWGLGALDLVFSGGGVLLGWRLALLCSEDPLPRILIAAPLAIAGLVLGMGRVADLPCRRWLALGAAYAIRRRLLLADGRP